MWIREKLQNGIIKKIQWRDTRDSTADGHTKGNVDRQAIINLMKGSQKYTHPVKTYEPHRNLIDTE